MGQRSQIYISWENDNGEQELVARYFGWNFSERMVSRAAALMEHLSEMIDNNHFDKNKIIKISEINFDMRDVVQTSDLIEEALDFSDNSDDIHDLLFNSDNNDGKLFIAVHKADGEHPNKFGRSVPNRKIQYCFTDCDNQRVMDAEKYLQWECRTYTGNDNGDKSWKSYLEDDEIKYTERNIKTIDEAGELMIDKELQYFINYDYPCLQKDEPNKPKTKANMEVER